MRCYSRRIASCVGIESTRGIPMNLARLRGMILGCMVTLVVVVAVAVVKRMGGGW
jgi:hypothetical protein